MLAGHNKASHAENLIDSILRIEGNNAIITQIDFNFDVINCVISEV
jgi:hypothetical protein